MTNEQSETNKLSKLFKLTLIMSVVINKKPSTNGSVEGSLADVLRNASDGAGSMVLDAEMVEKLKTMVAAEVTSKVKKAKKGRRPRDPNAPKRPQSAYMLWLNKSREQIVSDHFTDESGECTLTGREKVTEVAKKAGELWKELSDEDKAPFEEQNAQDKEEYMKLKEEYTPSANLAPTDPDEIPEAPEGWSGPFADTYLALTIKGYTKSYNSFAEAVAAAEELGAGSVGGITKQGTKYKLRLGSAPMPSAKGETCWIFGSAIVVAPKPSTESDNVEEPVEDSVEVDVKPKKAASSKKEAASKKQVQKKEAKEAPKKAASKKSAKKVQIVEPEPEPETDALNEDGTYEAEDEAASAPAPEEEDEELQLELEEIEGKEYLVDDGSGTVYDYEVYQDSEQLVKIGTYDGSTLTLD